MDQDDASLGLFYHRCCNCIQHLLRFRARVEWVRAPFGRCAADARARWVSDIGARIGVPAKRRHDKPCDRSPGQWGLRAAMHGHLPTASATLCVACECVCACAERNSKADAPVLLWLQGGPGASSLFGMFTEIGTHSIPRTAAASTHARACQSAYARAGARARPLTADAYAHSHGHARGRS